jgi:hypothetical protein
MQHELKSLPHYFAAVVDGRKPFEVRRNDRGFQEGDVLWLREHDGAAYTGRESYQRVSYLMLEYEDVIKPGYCILGLQQTNDGN